MHSIQRFAVTHPVAAYFLLTFAISWGGVLAALGGLEGMTAEAENEPRFIYAVITMLAGPSLSGLALTALVHGRQGLRDLGRRLLMWRAGVRWYSVALVAAPLMWLATSLTLSSITPRFLPGLFTSADKVSALMFGLSVGAVVGVLEELGWFGFAIPELRRRHGIVATGFLLGVVWGAWHLLTNVFWAVGLTAGDWPLPIFLSARIAEMLFGTLAAFRVLMVWVYDRTESLPLTMVMHTSLTASVLVLDPAGMSGAILLTYGFALAATVWSVVLLLVVVNRWYSSPTDTAIDAGRCAAA
jgi:membrane protease YdiL (CAAX protease family)